MLRPNPRSGPTATRGTNNDAGTQSTLPWFRGTWAANGRATICIDKGSPLELNPTGAASAGRPLKFHCGVKPGAVNSIS